MIIIIIAIHVQQQFNIHLQTFKDNYVQKLRIGKQQKT